jgi:hypothetical protein
MPTIHYRGDGTEFLSGVPARHLDESEYRALPADQRKAVREAVQSGGKPLYDYQGFRSALSAQDQQQDDDVASAPEPVAEPELSAADAAPESAG